ncbi:MAG: response regulator [Patescibacteria group bacterium]|jgi:CheY-like chemotaxis protein
MKILVIENSAVHQQAAKNQLAEHDLMVVDSCFDAQSLIRKGDYDVVLTDLMLNDGFRWGCNEGGEIGSGVFVVLLAAMNHVRYIGLLSDTGRHAGWEAASLAELGGGKPMPITIQGAKVLLCSSDAGMIDNDGTKNWAKLLKALIEES